MRYFSLSRTIFWIALAFSAYFFGWLASVTFVALCSLYANAASDFAAWRADVPTNQDQLDHIELTVVQLSDKVDELQRLLSSN